MHRQQLQSCSLQTISIKLTENNLPSETVLKPSQQQISLTYTVSIQNIPQQKSLVYGNVKENLSISIEESMNLNPNDQRYVSQEKKLLEGSRTNNRNAFRKKSLLKISNLDFSNMFGQTKVDSSPQVNKPAKSIIRTNNSGLFARPSILNYESISGFNKNLYKSKQTFHFSSTEGLGQQILLRTSKFNSIKEDKIIEPLPLNKKFTIRKQIQKRQSCQSDRKSKKLPIIKGSNFHSSAPLSTSQRRKAFTSHQSMQLSDKCYGTLQQRTLMGKSCKINQNDQKARKYLQKIILNRNSIIHFIETKKNLHRQFKENYEDAGY